MTRHIPNFLTLCNLFCGCLGILYTFNSSLQISAYFVWAACVFDFLDGFAARSLRTTSSIGKELDSLADMVSFGVLPSMVMYRWMTEAAPGNSIAYLAFLIALFSALRLAKFNIDDRQTDHFIGVPTPANTLFITGLIFLKPPFDFITSGIVSLTITTILFSLLMVAPIDLFALKFKNFSWVDNKLRLTFAAAAVLLLILLKAAAVPLVILLYIVLSLVVGILLKK